MNGRKSRCAFEAVVEDNSIVLNPAMSSEWVNVYAEDPLYRDMLLNKKIEKYKRVKEAHIFVRIYKISRIN